MVKVVKSERITENGVDYILETYSNGSTVKVEFQEVECTGEPPVEEIAPTPEPSVEDIITQTLLTAEYTACLLEINGGV